MELELQLEAPEVQEGSYAAQHLAGQSRSASIDFQVEKAPDLYEVKRSASQPTLRGATSPVTRLQIEVKPAGSPAAAWLSTTTEAEGATLGNDCSAPQPPPCTPRGSRAGSKLLDPPGSRAMCFDFDLTLIPRHTGGMPRPGQPLAPGQYLRDLRAHLVGLVRADFDLYIVTRGDVRAVRAALGCCHDSAAPAGLDSWFRAIYGANETDGLPITRRVESFTEQDMRRIQSVASPDAWARLSNGRAEAASAPAPNRGGVQEQTPNAEHSVVTDGSERGWALVGRENAALANKLWWAWKKCEFLEHIIREGGYSPGMVWFADDTAENVVAVDTLLRDRVHTVHVDGAFGRGILGNRTYLDATGPLLATGAAPSASDTDLADTAVGATALETQLRVSGEEYSSDDAGTDSVALPFVAPTESGDEQANHN